jgi:hypothetical protein
MNQEILKIKEEQKALGKHIRELKKKRKGNGSDWRLQCEIEEKSREFRHKHIARCELRGRTREQIEAKVRDGNEPNESQISVYKSKYLKRIESAMEPVLEKVAS